MARRVKLSDLLGDPLEVEAVAAEGQEPKVAYVQSLGVDDMMRLYQLEATLDAEGKGDDDAVQMSSTRDFVCALIERDNPDFFPKEPKQVEEPDGDGGVRTVTKDVSVYPNWPPSVVIAIMAALAGDMTVADGVANAVLGDDEERAQQESLNEAERAEAVEAGEDLPEVESDLDDPSTLTSHLPTRSLSADEHSDGGLNGGSTLDAPGTHSEDISDISVARV